MGVLVQLVVIGFSVWVATAIVPGLDFTGSGWALAGIAIVVAVANVLVKPLLTVLSLPLIVGTLGLFYVVVNWAVFALVVWLSGPGVLDLGLTSSSWTATLLGAVVMSVVGFVVRAVLDRP